jgi:hypothetical protein
MSDPEEAASATSEPSVPSRRRALNWVVRGILVALSLLAIVAVIDFLNDPLGLKGDLSAVGKDARASLSYAVPSPSDDHGRFIPLRNFDAARMHTESDLSSRGLRFVGSDQPSTGPNVLSVNPIDDLTWGAAAKSTDGTCYLIGLILSPPDGQYGSIVYGASSARPCRGLLATRETLTQSDWPSM